MKKLLIATTVLGSLFSSMASAKTEGNYVGIDLLGTNFRAKGLEGGKDNSFDPGLGVNYKYAFNMNGLYLAPGIYFNFNNADTTVRDSSGEAKTTLDYSYGAKLELGYDVTDKMAPFVSFGYQQNQHRFRSVDVVGNEYADDDNLGSTVYGAGVKYSVNPNIDVAVAYEYVNYTSNDVKGNSTNPEVYKLGMAYKF